MFGVLKPSELPPEIEIRKVVQATRDDFEAGRIAADYVLDLLLQPISRFLRTPALDVIKEDLEGFPEGNCGIAAAVLKDRLKIGEVINGSYDTGEERPHTIHWATSVGGPATVHKPHSFWGVQVAEFPRAEASRIGLIADITADQFNGRTKVYVGGLRSPWMVDSISIEDIDPELGY